MLDSRPGRKSTTTLADKGGTGHQANMDQLLLSACVLASFCCHQMSEHATTVAQMQAPSKLV